MIAGLRLAHPVVSCRSDCTGPEDFRGPCSARQADCYCKNKALAVASLNRCLHSCPLGEQDKLHLQGKTLKDMNADSSGLETHANQQFWMLQQTMSKLENKMLIAAKRARGHSSSSRQLTNRSGKSSVASRLRQAASKASKSAPALAMAMDRLKPPGSPAEAKRALEKGSVHVCMCLPLAPCFTASRHAGMTCSLPCFRQPRRKLACRRALAKAVAGPVHALKCHNPMPQPDGPGRAAPAGVAKRMAPLPQRQRTTTATMTTMMTSMKRWSVWTTTLTPSWSHRAHRLVMTLRVQPRGGHNGHGRAQGAARGQRRGRPPRQPAPGGLLQSPRRTKSTQRQSTSGASKGSAHVKVMRVGVRVRVKLRVTARVTVGTRQRRHQLPMLLTTKRPRNLATVLAKSLAVPAGGDHQRPQSGETSPGVAPIAAAPAAHAGVCGRDSPAVLCFVVCCSRQDILGKPMARPHGSSCCRQCSR